MLTAKEIEEAKHEIRRHLIAYKASYLFPSDIDNFTLPLLDALCAQAHLTAEVMADGDFSGHTVEDFEIEPTGAKGGDEQ